MPFSARSSPCLVGDAAHAVLAPDQDRRAEPLVDEGIGGADDLLLLALGEDDALGIAAHALDDPLQRAGDRIAPRRQLRTCRRSCRRSGVRATPESIAALATAAGITVMRRGSNGTGMM